jgi:LysM repeat protein
MSFFFNSKYIQNYLLCLLVLCCASVAGAAMDPRFELDPSVLSGTKSPSKPSAKGEKRSSSSKAEKTAASAEKHGTSYTVKPGDHLFKILMRDYGLNNNEAESFIEEIKRENNIYDIKRLKIGQKITIPPVRRRADGSLKIIQSIQAGYKGSDATGSAGQSFALESPVPMLSEQEAGSRIRETWDKLVPAKADLQRPINLQTSTFSLTLDPQRYPSFAAMDGGRILLDRGNSIPPLVRTLIQGKDPSLRIVSGAAAGTNSFLSSMLEAAGFYSVEENFVMDFGVDPKLSFHADFKIEKSAESLNKQDVVLMNSGPNTTPPALGDFLKKEGFTLYEPFASIRHFAVKTPRAIHQITSKKQPEIVDAIFKAFSINSDRDRHLDVFAADNNGISLAVKAERYFERGGQRFVITSFDGDPVNYTLFRILETKGYKVVILEPQDDFRKVSEKIISNMKVKGSFAKHNLLQNRATNYALQMSGFSLDDASLSGGGVFLTNLEMDRIVKELLTENGYSINDK